MPKIYLKKNIFLLTKKYLIYKPRIYLFEILGCFRGLTKIGKIITPTVKTHIGATTINIDSKDIE